VERIRRIVVAIRHGPTWDRRIVAGIQDYVRPGLPWMLKYAFTPVTGSVAHLRDWKPDGIIGACRSSQVEQRLSLPGVPFVSLFIPDSRHPRVDVDNRAAGRLAAEHLLECRFRSFGFLGESQPGYSPEREAGFRESLAAAGFPLDAYHLETSQDGALGPSAMAPLQAGLLRWLRRLPQPTAVLACNDFYAFQVVDACHRLGLHVPRDLAVLGIDGDESLCRMAYPALSSIAMPAEARMLDDLMHGRPVVPRTVILKPVRVIERESTNVLQTEDPTLAKAVAFIREHVAERISVADVARHTPCSRRVLEKRFRRVLGRSVLEEVHAARLRRCRTLLAETRESMSDVARHTGFRDAKHLALEFRRKTGLSPTGFRVQYQGAEGKPRAS